MYEDLIESVVVNSTKYLKFIVQDEEEIKEILKQVVGKPCYDREHNHPDIINYFVDGGNHVADYYPENKTLIIRKSYSLREGSDFNKHFVASEIERALHMAKTAADYSQVKGWAMQDGPTFVEYARGTGKNAISISVSKKNGNWEVTKGDKTMDAGRNATPDKVVKILQQAIKVYG